MKNLFKQKDIFICKHDVHKQFSSHMSVYHVLENKHCFPEGCIYFKWKCKILAKRKKCHRNFSTVGRKCFSCKYFYEEKIHQYPELIISRDEKDNFFKKYEEYVDWIQSLTNKRVFCEGRINSVKPDFSIRAIDGNLKINISGFLVSFKEGFIQNQLFEDRFFLHISTMLQNKLRLRQEDEIEFYADLKIVKGKVEFYRPNKIDFFLRGTGRSLTKSNALTSLSTASVFWEQPDQCKRCIHSIMPEIQGAQYGRKRALICMDGIKDHHFCISFSKDKILSESERCGDSEWNDIHCKQTL